MIELFVLLCVSGQPDVCIWIARNSGRADGELLRMKEADAA